mmetsp:Transcript_30779/g.89908  ORF Transcript_30779/g.89908 Transcript_30779/m.89908 type:complete len:219 (-) Transcript_30779:1425-2081(-)
MLAIVHVWCYAGNHHSPIVFAHETLLQNLCQLATSEGDMFHRVTGGECANDFLQRQQTCIDLGTFHPRCTRCLRGISSSFCTSQVDKSQTAVFDSCLSPAIGLEADLQHGMATRTIGVLRGRAGGPIRCPILHQLHQLCRTRDGMLGKAREAHLTSVILETFDWRAAIEQIEEFARVYLKERCRDSEMPELRFVGQIKHILRREVVQTRIGIVLVTCI